MWPHVTDSACGNAYLGVWIVIGLWDQRTTRTLEISTHLRVSQAGKQFLRFDYFSLGLFFITGAGIFSKIWWKGGSGKSVRSSGKPWFSSADMPDLTQRKTTHRNLSGCFLNQWERSHRELQNTLNPSGILKKLKQGKGVNSELTLAPQQKRQLGLLNPQIIPAGPTYWTSSNISTP